MTLPFISRSRRLALPCAAGLLTLGACTDAGAPTGVRAPAGAPRVAALSAATLVPGRTVTLTGANFDPAARRNTVRIGGVAATVTGGGADALQVVVPCVPSGPAWVEVEHAGGAGAPVRGAVHAPRRTLAPGQSLVLSRAGEAACNELAPSGTDARYVLAVYNTDTDPLSSTAFELSAPGNAAAGPGQSHGGGPRAALAPAPVPAGNARHLGILEMNRREHARLRARFAGDGRMHARGSVSASPAPPPLTRTLRVVDIAGGSCDRYFTVSATRVYYDGKIAIYEDDATPAWARAAANPRMRAYYRTLGDEYNADMETLLRRGFGDPLLRDRQTDANGVLVALFTPLINQAFAGVPAFVVSCDLFPREEGNAGSNFGEFVYGFQPTVDGTGYAALTPDDWFSNIRGGIMHEAKHLASLSARVQADAWFDEPWLEEGTARHAEELWARNAVYNVGWKANTGYGSASAPNSVYCDLKRTDPTCLAADPSRPAVAMFRHFYELSFYLRYPAYFSPFGPTEAGGGASFYGSSWSLVRYAIDRYGSSDAGFLRALVASEETGADNLAARAGVPFERLMGGWALSQYTDDYPGPARANRDLQVPTWNFRDIYAGLHGELGFSFPTPYPLQPHPLTFGAVGSVEVPFVAGGGVAYFELSGPHARAQLLRLRGADGGALPSTLRLAVARLR